MVGARRRQDELEAVHLLDHLGDRRRLAGDEHLARLALEPREVREEPPQRRRAVRDPGQVLLEPVVEVEPAGVAQLQDRRRRERLRDRADPVLQVGCGRAAFLEIGEADGPRPGDLAVTEDGGGDRRQLLLGLTLLEQRARASGRAR